MAENLDYRLATQEERRHALFPGDPAADYFFVDKRWQDLIFEDERKAAAQEGVEPTQPQNNGEVAIIEAVSGVVVAAALRILDEEAIAKV